MNDSTCSHGKSAPVETVLGGCVMCAYKAGFDAGRKWVDLIPNQEVQRFVRGLMDGGNTFMSQLEGWLKLLPPPPK